MAEIIPLRGPRRPEPPAPPEEQRGPLRLRGVSRDAAEPCSLVLSFNRPPTDAELRFIHESTGQAAHYAWLYGVVEEGDGA